MPSYLYIEPCFPVKPVWLPLLLLPGPGIGCICVTVAVTVALCVFASLFTVCASMERCRNGSEDNPHQSPAQEENGERHRGWKERWRSPQEAAFGEMMKRGEGGKVDE